MATSACSGVTTAWSALLPGAGSKVLLVVIVVVYLLQRLQASHFLRVTMDLSVAHAPKGEAKEGSDDSFPVAKTRDTVISVLTSAKANDLLTPEGKAALKRNVLTALQQRVPEIDAKDVYFTEFLVQR